MTDNGHLLVGCYVTSQATSAARLPSKQCRHDTSSHRACRTVGQRQMAQFYEMLRGLVTPVLLRCRPHHYSHVQPFSVLTKR
jgi:hypothetical protein